MAQVFREQRQEMQNTMVAIRQKIADAQVAIRNHNNKTKRLDEEKANANARYAEAHVKRVELRNLIADRERDLWDAENKIPLAKSKLHELASVYGENKHFEKTLARTRQEVEDLQVEKKEMHVEAKTKAEDCWKAMQKLHGLELSVEEADRKIEFCTRRIIVARERIGAVETQTNTVSMNYVQSSKNEMEKKYFEMQDKVNAAKERRKKTEEKVLHLTWETEELSKQVHMYHDKMREMYAGQRELASSKLL